jgi:uncharacterized protein YtpQ (UPF0354 family)
MHMAFGMRAALRLVVVFFVALSVNSPAADAREPKGVPKSAPAFTKFVGVIIMKTLPGTMVTVSGRLRLDVRPPSGKLHTTDLHNIYSLCQRVPDRCEDEVTNFVADSAYNYKNEYTGPSRATLRVVVRPSAYVAALRVNPKRNRPITVPLVGDLWIIVVNDLPTSVAMLDENDLAALNLSAQDALSMAMSNTKAALEKSVHETLLKGCTGGLFGDATYVASAAAFPDLWADAAQRCNGTLFISIPGPDAILFTDGTKSNTVAVLAKYSAKIAAEDEKPFDNSVFRWTPKGWALLPPAN